MDQTNGIKCVLHYYKDAKMAEGAVAFKDFLTNKIEDNKTLARKQHNQ